MDPNTMRRYLDAGTRELRHRANRVAAQLDGRAFTDRQRKALRKAELILCLCDELKAKDE